MERFSEAAAESSSRTESLSGMARLEARAEIIAELLDQS